MAARLRMELPRDLRAPATARSSLQQLDDALAPDLLPDVRLLVSELVSNSVKYGGQGAVRLEVTASPELVRAEIVDRGAGFEPKARDRPLEEVGGWGLHLVEHLADRWGTYEGSTHVWFEIRPNGAEAAA